MKRIGVGYYRYSSSGQANISDGESSTIAAQRSAVEAYCKNNNIELVGEYADKASSAFSNSISQRVQFATMLKDSEKDEFDVVLVYDTSRFSRNKFDSVIARKALADNGVKVISVTENLDDETADGKLLLAILEGMSEHYSNSLSARVRASQQRIAGLAEKGSPQFLGGTIPTGFKIIDKRYELDEVYAPIVADIFEKFARGVNMVEIIDRFNASGIKTPTGKPFVKNSLQNLIRNPRYRAVYKYGDIFIEDAIPRIVSDEIWFACQERLEKRKHAPMPRKNYLLTGKLYCEPCESPMVGYGGTSKTGAKHLYYSCNGYREKKCAMKNVRQAYVEDLIVDVCREMLSDVNINRIAKAISALQEKEMDNPYLKQLKKEQGKTETAIESLTAALEHGEDIDYYVNRIKEKRARLNELGIQLAKEELAKEFLSESAITAFLTDLKQAHEDSEQQRKALVSTLVNKVYLSDGKVAIYFNVGGNPVEITTDLRKEVEEVTDDEGSYSPLVAED